MKAYFLFCVFFLNSASAQYESIGPYGGYVQKLITDNQGRVLAATFNGGIFRTSNGGDFWEQIFTNYRYTDVRSLAVNSSGHIFAGTDAAGLYRSTNDGQAWEMLNNTIANKTILDILIQEDGDIFAATFNGIYKSSDNGNSFSDISNGISSSYIYCLGEVGEYIFAGTGFGGIFRTSDEGLNWEEANNGINNFQSEIVKAIGYLPATNESMTSAGSIYIGLGNKMYKTSNSGGMWNMLPAPQVSISDILVKPNDIYATSTAGVMVEGTVIHSTNGGDNWVTIFENKQPLNTIAQVLETIVVGASGGGTFGSVGGGVWEIKVSGMNNTFITSMHHDYVSDNVKVTARYVGVYETTNFGETWDNKTFNLPYVWVNTSDVSSVTNTWVVNTSGGNYRLPSGSENWHPTGGFYNGIKADNSGNFYGWSGPNIYRSTDDAITFNFFTAAPYRISNLEFNNSGDMFAATNNQSGTGTGIYLFNGTNWNEMNNGLTDWDVTVLEKLNPSVSISYCAREIVCATKTGKYFALDESNNWNEFSSGLSNNLDIKDVGGFYNESGYNVDVISTESIHRMDESNCDFELELSLNNEEIVKSVYILFSRENTDEAIGFYGTNGSGILKKDLLVGVKTVETIIPDKFNLEQNYPNPFNPSTTISWQSPVSSWQTLKIYDLLGGEVATLVDEYRPAGSYEVVFDAVDLSSGVYLYKLKAGEYTAARKLLLMK